jgi:hypothetical protein
MAIGGLGFGKINPTFTTFCPYDETIADFGGLTKPPTLIPRQTLGSATSL